MNLVKIGEGFQLPSTIDLSILDDLPVYIHKYGSPQPPKGTFHWMTYHNENDITGDIAFARNCGQFFPEVAAYAKDYLENLLGSNLLASRVNFMKTTGDITPHTDEGRTCCINIGIRNTDAADTLFHLPDGTLERHVVEPGSAYLVNVSNTHSVKATRPVERLLITYGFGMTFDQILNIISPRISSLASA
jgi:hypothetical protein